MRVRRVAICEAFLGYRQLIRRLLLANLFVRCRDVFAHSSREVTSGRQLWGLEQGSPVGALLVRLGTGECSSS
jgi:hypothetical protein